ncbi:hypothetical protein EC968_007823 [Mortierella alpina]|nr:hypothetical protein EC968_007823 [Mortierella alpina]
MDRQHSPLPKMHPYSFTSEALVLPEVLFHIGCYLNASQVLVCSQVCSTWYLNFAPLVWANLRIGQPNQNATGSKYRYQRVLEPRTRSIDLVSQGCNTSEQLDIIRSKVSWLRSLTIDKHLSPQLLTLGKECTQLKAISIAGPIPFNDEYTREYWNSCKALIKQNRSSLTSLSVHDMKSIWNKPVPGVPRWNPILSCAKHTNLTELKLVVCHIYGRHLKPFWKICERLEKLTLDRVVFDYSRLPTQEQIQNNSKEARAARAKAAKRPNKRAPPPPPPPKRFPNLRELTINEFPHRGLGRFLDLVIADCPRLESLDWNFCSSFWIEAEHFSNLIIDGTWPHLDKIRLHANFYVFTEHQFFNILKQNRKQLKVLSINYCNFPNFGEKTFNVIKERHFSTLQEIDLSFLNAECWIQAILATCPSLEVVTGIRLCASTVMEDKRPWACLGLKEFSMSLEITKGSAEDASVAAQEQRQQESRALYSQLARLRRLQSLALSLRHASLVDKEPLPLRLEMGLDLLAGQTELEMINLPKGQNMDRKDILWIVENLTSLRMISGGRLSDRTVGKWACKDKYLWDYELSLILNRHGIETPKSIYKDDYLDDVSHLLGKGWPETDDLLYEEETPAGLEETAQAVAHEETTEAAVFEDAIQAVEPEAMVQIVEPEETVLTQIPEATDSIVELEGIIQTVENEVTVQAVEPEETVQPAQPQGMVQAVIPG